MRPIAVQDSVVAIFCAAAVLSLVAEIVLVGEFLPIFLHAIIAGLAIGLALKTWGPISRR